jgi:lysophospholipase L1-like esterase
MIAPAARLCRLGWLMLLLAWAGAVGLAAADATKERWVGAWATAPVAEPAAKENLALAGATLRQVIRTSLGGDTVRVKLSNVFGESPLVIQRSALALAGPDGAIQPGSSRELFFDGRSDVTIPPGVAMLSDPLPFAVGPQADVTLSILLSEVPSTLTAHPGSRAHSYLQPGDATALDALPGAAKTVHWYFLTGLDVIATSPKAGAFVVLGDSITDGYGVQPATNQRWTDALVRRLRAGGKSPPVGVLNLGIGGNALLRDGGGPAALARFDRDVLAQAGARWLLVFEGINDIGTRLEARKRGAAHASAADIIAALGQLAARARAGGLRVFGATITPYRGADFYWSPDGEADRQTVNGWIRTSGRFDAVVDFDAALRDPKNPDRLAPEYDSGDHLHPSMTGYRRLAEAVDPKLFTR